MWFAVIVLVAAGAVVLSLVYAPPESDGVAEESAVQGDTALAIPDSVSILVLNGAGIDDLARTVQRYLVTRQDAGTVIYAPGDPGNADSMDYEMTVVVSHLQDISGAVIVAAELDLTAGSVVWQLPVTGEPPVDVTVYLGKDMAGRSFVPFSD
jgi:hypothetical protein